MLVHMFRKLSFSAKSYKSLYVAGVIALLLVFAIELVVQARRQSMSYDEGVHTFAGYSYLTRGDFGMNPEHPPLVKMIAALPLLKWQVPYLSIPPTFFKLVCVLGAKQMFYSAHSADAMLFRARMAVAVLAIAAALLVFAVAYEMFHPMAALVALLLFVFEPNLIAHGSFVTTDMAVSLFLFATVFAFYRYVKRPSWWSLMLVSILAGLTLAAKHSGILWLPILCLLALAEIVRNDRTSPLCDGGRWRSLLRLGGSLVVVGVISWGILWSFYGFRYQARPQGQVMTPTLAEYAADIKRPWQQKTILFAARHHVLPEAYLFGLTDVIVVPEKFMTMYLFGKLYRHARWFYFPAAFLIKSTLGFLLLLLLVPILLVRHRKERWREFLFLLVPLGVYFLAAAQSGFNIGVRHILPIYVVCIVLGAFAAWRLAQHSRAWRYAVVLLLLFHCVSSALAFPNYLPYSNEIWGGSAKTYKYLTDSNVDWGQQLKSTKRYLDEHGIKDCWFDYFGRGLVAPPEYYGISCKPLQDAIDFTSDLNVPPHISGTVLISATELYSTWGPGELNPYAQFQQLRPDTLIDDGIFVFHGEFDVLLASAVAHARGAQGVFFNPTPTEEELRHALLELQTAVSLAPNDATSYALLAGVLAKMNRGQEAGAAARRALSLAQTIHPEFQDQLIKELGGAGP
jgi:4-amino-4-deoxy-L-arabinose transferase-like glycosyltransferase